VKLHLTQFQKRLCNILQDGLPICRRPFADIAVFLHSSETEVLSETAKLKAQGVIRRICALINHRALGRCSTLVAAHVAREELGTVVEMINAMPGVSHNYLRKHFYNLWFTLQGRSERELELEIGNLSARLGIELHSLAAEKVFKLDVRFDAESGGKALLPDIGEHIESEPVKLSENQKVILQKLQEGLEVVEHPFDILYSEDIDRLTVFRTIETLLNKGLIRRIAAVVDHHKLGFTANLMFCCKVKPERVTTAGEKLARLPVVSHCYQRKTFEGWPYNLFAMMHAGSMGQIQHTIEQFVRDCQITDYELLPTETEFKKEPVKFEF
jgi:DNA-binding Lrp family transcriptional regulator